MQPSTPRSFRVELGRLGRVRCEPGWRIGAEWSARLHDYDLWFVWAGRGRLQVDGGPVVPLAPGAGVWMRPGRRYEAEQEASDRLGVSYIHFRLLRPSADLPLSGFRPPFEVFHTRHIDFTAAVMRRVVDLHQERHAPPRAAVASATALFADLLVELAREHAAAGRATRPPPAPRESAVARTVALIREDPGRAPGIPALARAAGFSVDHFSRIFKDATGLPPESFIIAAKMERARRLLEETSLPVGAIAESLRFGDIYFFSRQFKQKTGCTPSEWRRRAAAGPRRA